MGKIEDILFEETLVSLKIMQIANSLKIISNNFSYHTTDPLSKNLLKITRFMSIKLGGLFCHYDTIQFRNQIPFRLFTVPFMYART